MRKALSREKNLTTPLPKSDGVPERSSWPPRRRREISFKRLTAVYILIVIIILFSLLSPHYFFAIATAQQVLNQYSISGLVGLALLLPLATGLFDLSVASVASLAGTAAAWFLANVSANPVLAVVVGLVAALLVGLVNAVVVLVMEIDSFIGTLATSGMVLAIATAIGGNTTITTNVNGSFQENVALRNLGGVTEPVFICLGVAVVLYVALQRTIFGRRSYAIGFDTEAARLGGIHVKSVRLVGLLVSAAVAGLAGILETASIGASDPSIGSAFLLPAFAVAFLGTTQVRSGRFNVPGTVISILLLGTGNVGLLIIGGPNWSPDVFDGVILIAAVGLTSAGRIRVLRLKRALSKRDRGNSTAGSVPRVP